MKFIITNNNGSATIPSSALALSKLENRPLEFHTEEYLTAIIPAKMDAMTLIRTLDSLSELQIKLLDALVESCTGPGCEDEPICEHLLKAEKIQIPDWVKEEAGIDKDSKLECTADPESGEVVVYEADYRYDIDDVPKETLAMLVSAGVCLLALDEHLMEEDIIYGE